MYNRGQADGRWALGVPTEESMRTDAASGSSGQRTAVHGSITAHSPHPRPVRTRSYSASSSGRAQPSDPRFQRTDAGSASSSSTATPLRPPTSTSPDLEGDGTVRPLVRGIAATFHATFAGDTLSAPDRLGRADGRVLRVALEDARRERWVEIVAASLATNGTMPRFASESRARSTTSHGSGPRPLPAGTIGPGSRPSRTWPTARVRSHDLGPRHGRRAPFLSFAGGPPIQRPVRVFHSPQVRHAHRRYF
jgi:hypothetical protein